ncbi:tweety-related [Anaeramoeba flamelloides]|uniref:Tweety-related n=1 Tax=Anaeramoeba flamelloides TaxID=1746091 RepID=A0AAV7ZPR2_9EUKA|nr:tweety-related [Anaeramoeba flamelloides]
MLLVLGYNSGDPQWVHSWKRMNLKGERINNRICNYSDSKCHWDNYFSSLLTIILLFSIISLFCLIFFLFWACFNPLLHKVKSRLNYSFTPNCCSFFYKIHLRHISDQLQRVKKKKKEKEKQTENIQENENANENEKKPLIKKKSKRRTKIRTKPFLRIFLILFFLLTLLSYCFVIIGSKLVSRGVCEVNSTILKQSKELKSIVSNIDKTLREFNSNLNFDSVIKSTENFTRKTEQIKKQFDHYNNIRETLVIIFFTLVIVLISFTFLLLIKQTKQGISHKTKKILRFVGIASFVFGSILWLIVSFHIGGMVFVSDSCYEVGPKGEAEKALDSYLGCGDVAEFSDFLEPCKKYINLGKFYGCFSIESLCVFKYITTQGNLECLTTNFHCSLIKSKNPFIQWDRELIPNFEKGCYEPNTPFKPHDCGEKSQASCPTNLVWDKSQCLRIDTIEQCSNGNKFELFSSLCKKYLESKQVFLKSTNLLSEVSLLLNCSLVKDSWGSVTNSICKTTFQSIELIIISSSLFTFLLLIFAFASIHFSKNIKRFIDSEKIPLLTSLEIKQTTINDNSQIHKNVLIPLPVENNGNNDESTILNKNNDNSQRLNNTEKLSHRVKKKTKKSQYSRKKMFI